MGRVVAVCAVALAIVLNDDQLLPESALDWTVTAMNKAADRPDTAARTV
jgi:hypothetical protein